MNLVTTVKNKVIYFINKNKVCKTNMYDFVMESVEKRKTPNGAREKLVVQELFLKDNLEDIDIHNTAEYNFKYSTLYLKVADYDRWATDFSLCKKIDIYGTYELKLYIITKRDSNGEIYTGEFDYYISRSQAEDGLYDLAFAFFMLDTTRNKRFYKSEEEAEKALEEKLAFGRAIAEVNCLCGDIDNDFKDQDFKDQEFKSITTTCLNEFGRSGREQAEELLRLWRTDELPIGFDLDGVTLMKNKKTNIVFLTNRENQVLGIKGLKLDYFHSLPYTGVEGFEDELLNRYYEFPKEDQRYLDDLDTFIPVFKLSNGVIIQEGDYYYVNEGTSTVLTIYDDNSDRDKVGFEIESDAYMSLSIKD